MDNMIFKLTTSEKSDNKIVDEGFGHKLRIGQLIHEETGPTGWDCGMDVKVTEVFGNGNFVTVWHRDNDSNRTLWNKFGDAIDENGRVIKNHDSYIVRPKNNFVVNT